MNQSVNQAVEHLQQGVNQTSEVIQENASEGDVSNILKKQRVQEKNIMEVAKKLAEKLLIKK